MLFPWSTRDAKMRLGAGSKTTRRKGSGYLFRKVLRGCVIHAAMFKREELVVVLPGSKACPTSKGTKQVDQDTVKACSDTDIRLF